MQNAKHSEGPVNIQVRAVLGVDLNQDFVQGQLTGNAVFPVVRDFLCIVFSYFNVSSFCY